MKKLIHFICIIGFIFPTISEAQIFNKIKRAAQQGVENAVERKVEKEVQNAAQRQMEKYLEQVFGTSEESKEGSFDYGKIMAGMNANVATEERYQYSGFIDMEITGTDKKGKDIDPVIMKSFLNKNADHWAIEMNDPDKEVEKSIMIFDQKNQAGIFLMENEGEKYRMTYSLNLHQAMETDSMSAEMDQEMENFNLQKTGNAKTISGHLCEEYLAETEEYIANYWITPEPIEGLASIWSKDNPMMGKRMEEKYPQHFEDLPEGDILEMDYKSKVDESSSVMKVLEINEDASFNFVMEEYPNMMTAQ